MTLKYVPVIWNRTKIAYDAALLAFVGIYISVFLYLAPAYQDVTRPQDGQILRMQAFGTCAFLMLSLILCIGPLARLDRRFLPVLYNRRHFGVIACAVAFVHASYVIGWYMTYSPIDPYVAVLGANTSYAQILGFPFETFGVLALAILLVLAVTSHDFWLSFLTPPLWKALHMAIYVAYAAVTLHIALGYLQTAGNPAFAVIAMLCVTTVSALHFVAAAKEGAADCAVASAGGDAPWVRAGRLSDTVEGRAIVVTLVQGERVAVFRHKGMLSAISNVCAHQNGPLGEGKVVYGCVTCPWHGYQYRLADGCAPPPFTEKLPTYNLKLDGGTILLDPRANAPGTYVEPVKIVETATDGEVLR